MPPRCQPPHLTPLSPFPTGKPKPVSKINEEIYGEQRESTEKRRKKNGRENRGKKKKKSLNKVGKK
jgi:hypothetical protein